ncbi:hypothetical protein MAR_018424 [Mya arenaria]|uniref:Spaetzle domain-containing protein n=1 Tax=Mya arenaria TaxID=6604 RepID=A0ABY7EI41_MYAAR|nr:hypothetical protein MAR_018424 [Mya arenaria]
MNIERTGPTARTSGGHLKIGDVVSEHCRYGVSHVIIQVLGQENEEMTNGNIFYILLISTLIGANSAKRYPARKCVFSYEDAWTYGRVNPGHQWICSEDQYAETTYPTATIDALLTKYAHYKAELEITRSCVDFVDYNADSLEGYGTDTSSNSGVARLLAATTWTPVTKKSCYQSYFYIPGYICKPSGFVTRRVLVYSPHLDLIFKTEITDIPTSCICAKCDC